MTWLLDGNVLVALSLASHTHHSRVEKWFTQTMAVDDFATCSVTESTLLRLHSMMSVEQTLVAAWESLASFHSHPKHVFWAEDFSYLEIPSGRLTGHRQVTDAWLAELARRKGGKLATLDEGLALLWPESTQLIPF